jgi:hypothetical protein
MWARTRRLLPSFYFHIQYVLHGQYPETRVYHAWSKYEYVVHGQYPETLNSTNVPCILRNDLNSLRLYHK